MNPKEHPDAREIASEISDLVNSATGWEYTIRMDMIETALLEYGRREREKAIRESSATATHHDCSARCHNLIELGGHERIYCRSQISDEILSLLKSDERKREKGDGK